MPMSPEQFRSYLDDQIEEIMKYKWCLGIQLRHDPLLDKSMNEICDEWIRQFAASYRAHWEKEHGCTRGNAVG